MVSALYFSERTSFLRLSIRRSPWRLRFCRLRIVALAVGDVRASTPDSIVLPNAAALARFVLLIRFARVVDAIHGGCSDQYRITECDDE